MGSHETCAGIIGLTKMDWNNNTLYKDLPVTLVYSKAFADIRGTFGGAPCSEAVGG